MTRDMSAYEIVMKLARLVEIGRTVERLVREAEAIGRRFDVESARSPDSLVHTPMTCVVPDCYGPGESYELREAVSHALDDSPCVVDGVEALQDLSRELREFLGKVNAEPAGRRRKVNAEPARGRRKGAR